MKNSIPVFGIPKIPEDCTIILVAGLWFYANGPIARSLFEQGIYVLDQASQPSFKVRTHHLTRTLEKNPHVTTVIGQSGGAQVIVEMLKPANLPLQLVIQLKQIVMLNSGPMAGVKFSPLDPTSPLTLKYIPEMWVGKDFMMSDEDTMNLLSLSREQLEIMKRNLCPDSGLMVREIILRQLHWKHDVLGKLPDGMKLAVINSYNDRIIGSTAKKTAKLLVAKNPTAINETLGSGHMWTMQNMEEVKGFLFSKGFVF